MFEHDPSVSLNTLLKCQVRYLRTDDNILSLEALRNIYELVVQNLVKHGKDVILYVLCL